ncbi:MAG TPA: asparagine synthase-related protein [Candidatus Acidoferrales bacterium]|nr:asparagine synthase-related protein [Candidatus Acidoferrales bacterium]
MSGIVGIYDRSGAPVDRGLLQAFAHFLAQRGPDGRDTWSHGAIGLGHTMLRSTRESQIERQPASLDGQLWITADARIDCREELEKKLEQQGRGAAGRTRTDSDLILCAYASWGADCVQHLRGDFAFAIWDARKKLLFCARDHFGVKPFYYSDLGERFLFSNTLDCLRQHPDVSDDLNDAAIGDFLLFGVNCDAATTTFRDIRRLPAAHAMTVNSEGLRIQRYWSAPTEGRIRYRRTQDYVEHFQILLQAAVADRTRVERAGILLSGGLDSATIATTARELAGSTLDLRAYTVVYESLIPDQDGKHARAVAEFLRIPLQCIPMDRLQPFERWNDPEVRSPEPVDDPFFAGLFDQFRAIAADCRVVLSGEGPDNLMHFQMWPFTRDLVRNQEWGNLIRETSRYLWLRPSVVPGLKRRMQGLFGKDPTAPVYPRWLVPEFARRLNLKDRAREWSELPAARPHPLLPKAHASLSLPHWSAMFEHENAGVTGYPVEVRHPFLDLRVVNFLLALPPFPLFFEKQLLREVVAGRLPENVRTRRKTPLAGSPLLTHLRQTQTGWMDKMAWDAQMDSYVNKSEVAEFRSKTNSEQAHSDVRPLCLNFWLQSARKVRYNLRAEVRNA